MVVPDEQRGTILSRTLPCRPGATARDLCRMLDHKLRITSPQDYGLFKLIDGDGKSWCSGLAREIAGD